MLKVNKYLGMMNGGRGLRQFQNVHKLEEWGLKVGCQTGKFPEPMPQIPADFELDSVAVCTDQEQTQITGGEFIVKPEAIGGIDCTGVRFIDDFHRWTNDLSSATAKAGLKPVEKAATLFLNIGYGPLQTGAWFESICGEGHKLSKNLAANSQLLLTLWPRIVKEAKSLAPFGGSLSDGERARKHYVAHLPEQNLVQFRGVKVSPGTWMSLWKAGDAWDPSLTARLLVLGSLCMKKGWILTEEDLFAGTRMGASSCGDKPAPKSKAAAVRDAKAKQDALIQRQKNVMVAATKCIADVDVVNGFRMLMLAGTSQWTGFNRLMDQLTSPEKCLAHCIAWAMWGWLECLKKCQDCLSDAQGLHRCGIDTDFSVSKVEGLTPNSPEVRYQNALATRLQTFVDLITANRAGSLVERSQYYPFILAGLAATSQDVVQATLAQFEKDVKAWWAAKDCLGGPPDFRCLRFSISDTARDQSCLNGE